MSTAKRIYFLAGLPRSGSTLLANILAQHPQIYVTPTSGVVDMLVQVRNGWDRNDAFQAMDRKLSEETKASRPAGDAAGLFRAREAADLHRQEPLLGRVPRDGRGAGRRPRPVKVLVTVRDLRDVVASFERLYRKTSALGQVSQEANMALKFKTALGRAGVFIDDAQPVGRAYNAIRDAVTRGWKDRMHFIDYEDLTRRPKAVMEGVYRFLGEDGYEHDFERVEQVTFEDDFVYGFKDLHMIRQKVEPQPPQWPKVFDDAVFQSPIWKNVENAAQFWKLYLK